MDSAIQALGDRFPHLKDLSHDTTFTVRTEPLYDGREGFPVDKNVTTSGSSPMTLVVKNSNGLVVSLLPIPINTLPPLFLPEVSNVSEVSAIF